MIINKIGLLKPAKLQSKQKLYMVVLHHTAGPTIKSAEQTFLKERPGLGYHYMIDVDGTCYQYFEPETATNHAVGYNQGTVSISFVGGWKYGPVTEAQIHSVIDLLNGHVLPGRDTIRYLTGHKHCSPGRKIDPRFKGEPANNINLAIDKVQMLEIAELTGLMFEPAPV